MAVIQYQVSLRLMCPTWSSNKSKRRVMRFITMRLILVPIYPNTTLLFLLWNRGVTSWQTIILLMTYLPIHIFIDIVMFDIILQQDEWMNMIWSISPHVLSMVQNVELLFPDKFVRVHHSKKSKTMKTNAQYGDLWWRKTLLCTYLLSIPRDYWVLSIWTLTAKALQECLDA